MCSAKDGFSFLSGCADCFVVGGADPRNDGCVPRPLVIAKAEVLEATNV
jgi:hypothetical protein